MVFHFPLKVILCLWYICNSILPQTKDTQLQVITAGCPKQDINFLFQLWETDTAQILCCPWGRWLIKPAPLMMSYTGQTWMSKQTTCSVSQGIDKPTWGRTNNHVRSPSQWIPREWASHEHPTSTAFKRHAMRLPLLIQPREWSNPMTEGLLLHSSSASWDS